MKENRYITDDIKCRLVYSFYVKKGLSDIYDHIAYKIHLTCLNIILNSDISKYGGLFDELIFIFHAEDVNDHILKEFEFAIARMTNHYSNVSFIVEQNDPNLREGIIFEKYILDKLNDYDGLTLFFHTKGFNTDNYKDDDYPYLWLIGQYWFNMYVTKHYLQSFYNSNKLIYGWPYMCDDYHDQWLIGGSCYWMKCKDIYEYLKDCEEPKDKYIQRSCLAEYYFLKLIDRELVGYPDDNIIKNRIKYDYYNPGSNESFIKYIQNTMIYTTYISFMSFYNKIMNIIT